MSKNGLPGFSDGLVAVQDAGAQLALAAMICPAVSSENEHQPVALKGRFLDACAAPGGKLFHVIETHPELDVVALEMSSDRLATLMQEGNRLGHQRYDAIAGDATTLTWWDGRPFDYLMIDAPCSGSGTLRRHPEIKLLRSAGDIPRYQALQSALLDTLWQVLAPGGYLLYCTCSLFQAENDDIVGRFLEHHDAAKSSPIRLVTGQSTRFGWQLLPTDGDTDGFYFAKIDKSPQ